MSRRRSLVHNAPVRRVRIVCVGRPEHADGHAEHEVTVLHINTERLGEARPADAFEQPRDDWTGGVVDDPQPHTRWGRSPADPGDPGRIKVHLRCEKPQCTPVLEAGPELADRIASALIESGDRRVELRNIVSFASTLGGSSRTETGDAAGL